MSSKQTCQQCGRSAYADRWADVCLDCKPVRHR